MIYICIPTHNEQQTVGVVLWKLRQVLTEFPRDYQLLVADDASTDKTTDVLEPYTRVLPLTVIRSEQRNGYAASLEMLLREAVRRSEYPKRDVIVTLQADFSEEPDDVVALIKRMEAGADVAVGIKISRTPQPRMRRFARYLSGLFTRKQTWPEGVVTPFDGYRAYRLYGVKRAMEERGGERLIRYDGWAAHAELLRAVLPHSRRVEALEVDDRCDRLQRPRREKPMAAALQVRAMASGTAPSGLLSVEDLDRTAATASRSRDKAVARLNGERSRGNGANGRDRRPSHESRGRGGRPERSRSDGPRSEARGEGRGEGAGRTRRPAEGRQEHGRGEGARPERVRTDRGAQARPANRGEGGQQEGRRRTRGGGQRPAEAGTQPPDLEQTLLPGSDMIPGVDVGAGGDAGEAGLADGAAPRPKKRRRRRRKSGSGDATAAASAGAESLEGADGSLAGEEPRSVEDGGGGDGGDAGPDGAEDGSGGERKRRRRGGRRGGRGRRRGPRAEGEEGQDGSGGPDTPAEGDFDGPRGVSGAGSHEEAAPQRDAFGPASVDAAGDRN